MKILFFCSLNQLLIAISAGRLKILILSHQKVRNRSTMPVVIIKMRKGFSTEQKRTVVKEFTNTLVKTLGVDPGVVTILINEHELENIGNAGKLRCDP